MRIFKTTSGDYRVISEFPFTVSDITSVAHRIGREDGVIVFDWPVLTDEVDDFGIWQIWFVSPERDDSYLDHEELA